ncbi:DoxX family protein [Photobacterium rosenbergii]|uniref:DoxX family protein n=1 Tax=Photobacterium rosenbergii TaxID=294936 RepID=UPI001C99F447|nr:DoxX family protein [Photobacterium rosenbergii]MBY5946602.1 DoxX family protein [Photobacterium rosenbergii]
MNTLINKTLSSSATFASLALRVPAGIIFMAHGAQKLFGWFGGYGLEGTGKWMASIGLEPGFLMALMAGGAEFFGGLFILLGLLTRPTALVLAVTMVVAIVTVHLDKGLFISNGGYEFGLALLAMSASLLVSGAGRLGVDNWLLSRNLKEKTPALA